MKEWGVAWGSRIALGLFVAAFLVYAWIGILAVRRDRARARAEEQALSQRLERLQERAQSLSAQLDRIEGDTRAIRSAVGGK